jgi:hypothetical protein
MRERADARKHNLLLRALLVRARARGITRILGARTVELVAVPEHLEPAELGRDALLQALDLVVLELEDEPALDADQVIVMIADDLVARLAVAELALDREPALDQELERAIDGGLADLGMALADLREQLVDRDVVARPEELLDDRLALGGGVEPVLGDVGPPAIFELVRIVRPEVRALPHAFQLHRNCR